jgi:peptidoglycan/xylan/chitin deacetylase (PgdA/CDA1 family)
LQNERIKQMVESATGNTSGPWPERCLGAVSLTFDDGLKSHLATAIPLLDEHRVRGTFYLNPPREGDVAEWRAQLAPWNAAAQSGHEIGNHSLTHPCSENFAFKAGARGLEHMTLDEIEGDVLEAERRLRAGIPEQQDRSFAYPCYQTFVGAGGERQSYVPVIARHFVAGRALGETANDPARCDLYCLWSHPVERLAGAAMVGLAERAAAEGRWTVLTFHGVHEGHLSVSEGDLHELCAFLDRHRDRIWTAPLATVARRVRDWRQGSNTV